VGEKPVREILGTAVFKRLLAVCAASLAIVGTSAGMASAEYPPAGSSGSVSATTVTVGTTVQFAGNGFKAGSKVTISVDDAVYATVVAGDANATALGRSTSHFATAAYVRPVAQVAAAQGFSVRVTMNKLGMNVLTGVGVDPAGGTRTVTAKVTVTPVTAAAGGTKGSNLPFTGSSVIIPGAIVGLAMLAGGFLLLTTVRSRRVGNARS
jgi:hypothetical protein